MNFSLEQFFYFLGTLYFLFSLIILIAIVLAILLVIQKLRQINRSVSEKMEAISPFLSLLKTLKTHKVAPILTALPIIFKAISEYKQKRSSLN